MLVALTLVACGRVPWCPGALVPLHRFSTHNFGVWGTSSNGMGAGGKRSVLSFHVQGGAIFERAQSRSSKSLK